MQFLSQHQVLQPSTHSECSSSTLLGENVRNNPLGGVHDGILERAEAKAEALEADDCHQPVDKVADVIVSTQQQVSAVQVVQRHSPSSTDQIEQRTVKMRHTSSSSTERWAFQLCNRQVPTERWTFQLCIRERYSQVQFVEQVVDMTIVVLLMNPKIQS